MNEIFIHNYKEPMVNMCNWREEGNKGQTVGKAYVCFEYGFYNGGWDTSTGSCYVHLNSTINLL